VPDHDLVEPIASGAYGEVWLARNRFGTLRAVKIVWRDQISAEAFEREFRGLQRFEPVSRSHPGLVDVLTLGLLPDADGFTSRCTSPCACRCANAAVSLRPSWTTFSAGNVLRDCRTAPSVKGT
jgi:hypothetical protein